MHSRQKPKRQHFPHYLPSHKDTDDLSPHTEGVFQSSSRLKEKEGNLHQSSKGFAQGKQTSEVKLPTQQSVKESEFGDTRLLFPSISKKSNDFDDPSWMNTEKYGRKSPKRQLYQTKSRTFWETVNKDIEKMLAGTSSPDLGQENKALRDLERRLDKTPPEEVNTFEKFQKYIKSCKEGLDQLLIVISKGRLEQGKLLRRMWNENISAMQTCLKSELLAAASRIEASEQKAVEALKFSTPLPQEKILMEQSVNTETIYSDVDELKRRYNLLEDKCVEMEKLRVNELNKKGKDVETMEQKIWALERELGEYKNKVTSESTLTVGKSLKESSNSLLKNSQPMMIDERCDTFDLVYSMDRYIWTDPKKVHDKFSQTDVLDIVDLEHEISLRPATDEKFNDMFLRIQNNEEKEKDENEILPKLLLPLRLHSQRLSFYPMETKKSFLSPKKSLLYNETTAEMLTPDQLSQKISNELQSLSERMFTEEDEGPNARIHKMLELKELLTIIYNSFSDFCEIVKKKEETITTERVKSMIEKTEIQMRLNDAQRVSENWQLRFNRFFQKYRNLQNILLYENLESSIKKDKSEFLKPERSEDFDEAYLQIESEFKDVIRTRQRAQTKKITRTPNKTEFYQVRVKVPRNLEMSEETVRAIKFMRKLKEMPLLPNPSQKGEEIICRIISTIYTELLKNQKFRVREYPLYINLYQYLTNFHGNQKSIVESKMNDIVRLSLGLEKYSKVRMFLKLLTVITDHPYEHDGSDLTFYLESLMAMDDSNSSQPGIALVLGYEVRTMISSKQATDYVTAVFEKNSKFKNTISPNILLNFIKEAKEPDPKIKGKWIIEADMLIEKFLCEKYSYMESLYKPIFEAIKPANERFLSNDNFSFLMIALHKNKMPYLTVEKIFASIADMIDREKEKKYLSFLNFSEFFFYEKKLKTSEMEKWLKNVSQIQVSNLNQLEVEWELRKVLIKHRYVQIRVYDIYHQDLIDSIEFYFKNRHLSDENDAKLAWIRYRLLEEDSLERYLRRYIEKYFLPDAFLQLSKFAPD